MFIKTFYMGEIKGYIKFKDKKAIMKPLENQEGPVITWEINDNHNSKDYFMYKGIRYQFVSSVVSKK